MFRASITWLAVVLISGSGPVKSQKPPAAKVVPVSGAPHQLSPIDLSPYDIAAERELLDLANQARALAGVPPLHLDEGLTQAARVHAAEMAAQGQLSHQFPGEASLAQRLGTNSSLHLDRAGENVSLASTVDQAQQSLMQSPPHRENLMNPAYNVAGFGVFRSGPALYVAQDFAHSVPTSSAQQAEDTVAEGVARMRSAANLPPLQRTDGSAAQAGACAMARADALTGPLPPGHSILRYTTMQPENLPAGAAKSIDERGVHTLSVGTCYARTTHYPNGVYWVVLILN